MSTPTSPPSSPPPVAGTGPATGTRPENPPAGAPSAFGGSSSGSNFLDTIKGMFISPSGDMKWGTIIGAAGLGALGAVFGSGAGILGILLGGIGGAVGGSFLGPLLQGAVDWVSEKISGAASSPLIGRSAIPGPNPDAVLKDDVPIAQPGAPTINTTLIAPNMERFNVINERNMSTLINIESERRRIEAIPLTDTVGRKNATEAFLGKESKLEQYISDAQLWRQTAYDWNKKDRPQLIKAYDTARAGLGFGAPDPAHPPISEAPVGELNIPDMVGRMDEWGRLHSPANIMQKWNSDPSAKPPVKGLSPREKLYHTQLALDRVVDQYRPGGPEGIDISTSTLPGSFARAHSNFKRGAGHVVNFVWPFDDPVDTKVMDDYCVYSMQDCKNKLNPILNNTPARRLTPQERANAGAYIELGLSEAREAGDAAELRNFSKMQEYLNALEMREQCSKYHKHIAEAATSFHTDTVEKKFQPYIEQATQLKTNVEQMNKQIEALNKSRLRVMARGTSASDPDKHYITVRDDSNNSVVTMIAEKDATQWKITNAFHGDFDETKITSHPLSSPMPVADIFTDKGIVETASLGNVIKTALVPMQVALGIGGPAPVAATLSTPGAAVTPGATPGGSAGTPGARIPGSI